MNSLTLAALVCLAATAGALAAAKPAPTPGASPAADGGLFPGGSSKDPINIEADRLDYSDKDSKAIYSGGVVLIQGPTKLTCSVMTLYIDKGAPTPAPSATPTPIPTPAATGAASSSSTSQVKHMDCTGPVTIVSKTQTATGDSAIYDKPQNKVWLIGHVTLSDGPNVTKGDKLTYDLLTGKAIVETKATPQGHARVQSQFIPNSNDNSSPTPSPSPSAAKP
jgi:lipopolysaccharide export system protein LptA